jgi:hypothetical protein
MTVTSHLQLLGSVQNIWQIEVDDVVPNYKIWVIAQHKLLKVSQQLFLVFCLFDLDA